MSVNTVTGWYVCHRASCGAKGNVNSIQSSAPKRERKQPDFDDPPLSRVLNTIPSLYRDRCSWPLTTAWSRVGWQVRDAHGVHRGHVLRSYTGQEPKALTYVNDYCGLHFPKYQLIKQSITLVEDIPSAEALAPHTPTAALLGSVITKEHKKYLDALGIRMVYLALDEDAKAVAIAQARRHLSPTVIPILLEKDPKDMSDKELTELSLRIGE